MFKPFLLFQIMITIQITNLTKQVENELNFPVSEVRNSFRFVLENAIKKCVDEVLEQECSVRIIDNNGSQSIVA